MLSKLLDKDEVGKMFSLLGFAESLVPVAGSPAITLIFNHTLDVDPGVAFYCLAALGVCVLPITLYLDLLWRKIHRVKEGN